MQPRPPLLPYCWVIPKPSPQQFAAVRLPMICNLNILIIRWKCQNATQEPTFLLPLLISPLFTFPPKVAWYLSNDLLIFYLDNCVPFIILHFHSLVSRISESFLCLAIVTYIGQQIARGLWMEQANHSSPPLQHLAALHNAPFPMPHAVLPQEL